MLRGLAAIGLLLTSVGLGAMDLLDDGLPVFLQALNPMRPPCAGQVPEEPTADGDYRADAIPISTTFTNPRVAIADRGWRTLVLSDAGLGLLARDSSSPLLQVAVNDTLVADISLAADGSAFAVADHANGGSRLRYFECDGPAPRWSWQSDVGSLPRVVVGREGRWIAMTTSAPERLYLFRRDRQEAGLGAPVMTLELAADRPIKALAFSERGPVAAVVTGSSFDDDYTLHVVTRFGLRWSQALAGTRWGQPDGIALAMSAGGGRVAVAGYGGLLRLFDTASPTPLWTVALPGGGGEDRLIGGLALSADGATLGLLMNAFFDVPRDLVQIVRDTSAAPDFSSAANPAWVGGPEFGWSQSSPYPLPAPDIAPGPINFYNLDQIGLSADGQYLFVAAELHYLDGGGAYLQNRTAGLTFHRDVAGPVRIVLSGDQGVADRFGAISADGSWVVMAGENAAARAETAPFERISIARPVQIDIPLIGAIAGLGAVDVDYTVYKAGRASALGQRWSLHAMPFDVLLANVATCTGATSHAWSLAAPIGNAPIRGQRTIVLPDCVIGATLGIEGYDVVSELGDTDASEVYSTDHASALRVTIPD
ncbi:MAG: hypothetical protein H6983_20715 [Ectothiorhodospiraceae bacterium]|nr:hypothetical protein [Ectothiorhodospiraceae bacterium]